MSLQALRRWIARHPIAWVLGLALTLGGAQLAAAAHEFSHVAAAAAPSDGPHAGPHAGATHDCATCLLAAALGGAAPAPAAAVLAAASDAESVTARLEHGFAPRVTLAYASRAPPASLVLAA
jgi:hypothetical protein